MAVIDQKAWREALLVFGRMSGWVATPIVLALLVGRWYDARMGTGHKWFFISIGIGFFISVFGIYRESKKYVRQLDKEEAKEKQLKNDGTSPGNN